MTSTPVRAAHRSAALALSALTFGCAGGPVEDLPRIERAPVGWSQLWPDLAAGPTGPNEVFPAKRLDAAQIAVVKEAERLYRAGDEAYPEARARLATDPLASFWFARMLVRDLLHYRERVGIESAEEAMAGLAPWRRPFAELVALGRPAVPCIVLDLLRDPRANRRQLGVEVLAAMGEPILPELRPVLDVRDDLVRAAAVDAVARWPWTEHTRPLLEAASADEFFGVRAAAWSGFADGGAAAAQTLRDSYAAEPDPFVRQVMLRALGGERSAANARFLSDEYDRALAAGDTDTVGAAVEGLRRMSGRRGLAGPKEIREFVESLSAVGSDGSIGGDR